MYATQLSYIRDKTGGRESGILVPQTDSMQVVIAALMEPKGELHGCRAALGLRTE